VSDDDVLFGDRLQLFDLAGRTSVGHPCRTFGVQRSSSYVWKRQVDRHGLEMLRPRERRRPRMPNRLSAVVEERIVACALAHPGLGPPRIASQLARPPRGGIVVSANGVWRCLRRHGLNTRAKRFSLVAGYRAPTSHRASASRSRTSRSRGRASWSGSTATPPMPGPSSSSASRATQPAPRPPSSPAASPGSSSGRAGGSSACSPTDESQVDGGCDWWDPFVGCG
jgi:transposase